MPLPILVKMTKGLRFDSNRNPNFIAKIFHFVMIRKANIIWRKIEKYLKGKSVLDVGMGSGSITYFLKSKKFEVTSVDVKNLSIYEDLKPVLYGGDTMPFKNNSFETAVIVHVLHHCDDGEKVLKEARRVAKRVIFIEDTYRNWFEWLVVSVSDAINNGELWLHKYRTVAEWKKIIKRNNWKVVYYSEWSEWFVAAVYGRYCVFVIE